jgi:hypothetical protein
MRMCPSKLEKYMENRGKVDPLSSYTAGICWKAGCSETKTNPGGTTQEKMSLKR